MIIKKLSKENGGAGTWFLVVLVVVGISFYIYQKKETQSTPPPPKPEEPKTEQISEPTPVPTEEPTPPPIPEPIPTSEPTPTPEPTPEPLTLFKVSQDRSLWPSEVALIRPATLPLVMDGKTVGSAVKPVGSTMKVTRVTVLGVEVLFQNVPARVTPGTTDVLIRAEKIRAAKTNVIAAPEKAATVEARPLQPVPTTPVAVNAEAHANGPTFDPKRLLIEVLRNKRSRIAGGDYDDKLDRIEFKVKLENTDTRLSTETLKCRIFVFADSVLQRSDRVLLGRKEFECNLAPRTKTEFTTSEFTCAYDTTGARFGYKYGGWLLELRNSAGKVVLVKASAPSVEMATAHLNDLKDNGLYNSKYEYMGTVNPGANIYRTINP